MAENTNDAQQNLENKLAQQSKNSRNKKIKIGVLIGLIALGIFTVPKILKQFNKKEVVCLKNRTEIYEKYKDAVVLVEHTYAYEVSIKGSKSFIISASGSGNDERTVNGTGFFVTQDGKIVTNHHVAEPWNASDIKGNSESYIKERISQILPDSIQENQYKNYLDENWNVYNDEVGDYEDGESPEARQELNPEAIAVADKIINDSTLVVEDSENIGIETVPKENTEIKYVNFEDIEVKGISIKISVALHGSNDSWLPCKVLKISKDEEVDVAVLQLNSNQLPDSVSNIIDLNEAISDDMSIKPGTNAVLIGYPMGMTLASTRKGIKVQVYEGQINKESDGVSLQYNVTSTHGASGSPVFNQCGNLIAINYAGYDEAQGYNFGIVAKHAIELVE